jgi:hypothetical protein
LRKISQQSFQLVLVEEVFVDGLLEALLVSADVGRHVEQLV